MESDIADRLRRYFVTQRNQWNAADEIERLRKERDEARRAYCEEAFCHRFNERRFNERGATGPITDPQQIAHMMKWDCYKENTND